MKIEHFVLTRFNLNIRTFRKYGDWHGCDPAYLDRRFELFERYCLPAMKRQLVPFRWLVFFSSQTPAGYRERLQALSAGFPALEPIFVNDETPLDGVFKSDAVMCPVLNRLSDDADYFITTRIDNDDAFNVLALSWIRAAVEERLARERPDRFFVLLRNGNVYHEGRSFTQEYRWDLNHFPSLVCARGIRAQVLDVEHTKVKASGVPFVICTRPHAWLEVVNGSNLTNGFRPYCRSRFLSREDLRTQFAIETDMTFAGYTSVFLRSYLPAVIRYQLSKLKRRMTGRGGRSCG